MILKKILLVNFRNIKQLSLNFDRPVTILYGENGQGKTNIVESIYLLANANSFRTNYYKEMIQNEEVESIVQGEVTDEKREKKYKILLKKNGKTAFINDIMVTKFSEYIGNFNVVCFSPEDVSLFKDSPSIRRSFLDKQLSSLFPVYLKYLIEFKNILDQRNNLLKNETIDENLLSVIDEKIIELSYELFKRRKWIMEKIEEFSMAIFKKITNDNRQIKIVYNTFLNETDQNVYYQKAKEIYQSNLKKDKEKQFTTIGIHKDDFKVFLGDLEVDMYASQGQQRLISLSMKLAVIEIISKANKQEPIIVLDDAFSELDEIKKTKLLEYVLSKKQVFITCTDYKNIIKNKNYNKIALLHIQNGNVMERSYI